MREYFVWNSGLCENLGLLELTGFADSFGDLLQEHGLLFTFNLRVNRRSLLLVECADEGGRSLNLGVFTP